MKGIAPSLTFPDFQRTVLESLGDPEEHREESALTGPKDLFVWGKLLGFPDEDLTRLAADFLSLTFLERIEPSDLDLGQLSRRFCIGNQVAPILTGGGKKGVVVGNPFDWELIESIKQTVYRTEEPAILVATPETISHLFSYEATGAAGAGEKKAEPAPKTSGAPPPTVSATVDSHIAIDTSREAGEHPTALLANALLKNAVQERASDIHIEPKENETVIRARIDGDMRDLNTLPKQAGVMLLSRFKALAGLDIAEKRKPQDGGMTVMVEGREFKLRLATTSGPSGESMVIRLLEPDSKPKALSDLGMTEAQSQLLFGLANRHQGLILVVGPTGSGKSTTIYCLLSLVDVRRRSLISVEDPVEYRIAHANQQEVNEVAGVTFESLLKSAVRQDPDILYLGEIRDLTTAKAAMDFASSGHLSISTIHSANATTTIFRLERLGASRAAMAEALIGVVSQKLLRRLCDKCKEVRPPTDEERKKLAPFTQDIPDRVAAPVGCPSCRGIGYWGREGMYEILEFDPDVIRLVRENAAIGEIRNFIRDRGDFLISDHAIVKVRDLIFSVDDVYELVLVEEQIQSGPPPVAEATAQPTPTKAEPPPSAPQAARPGGARILVVDDDPDIRAMLEIYLRKANYQVTTADDGVAALMQLGSESFELILSDINMPNLDGLKLLEMLGQKGMETPVVFLTGETEAATEIRGLELGAADYVKKPIQKDVVLMRIDRVLKAAGR